MRFGCSFSLAKLQRPKVGPESLCNGFMRSKLFAVFLIYCAGPVLLSPDIRKCMHVTACLYVVGLLWVSNQIGFSCYFSNLGEATVEASTWLSQDASAGHSQWASSKTWVADGSGYCLILNLRTSRTATPTWFWLQDMSDAASLYRTLEGESLRALVPNAGPLKCRRNWTLVLEEAHSH